MMLVIGNGEMKKCELQHPTCQQSSLSLAAAKENDLLQYWQGDILVVGVTEEDMTKDAAAKFENSILRNLDSRFDGLLSEDSIDKKFTGKAGESMVIMVFDTGLERVSLIGLGKPTCPPALGFRAFGDAVASAAKAFKAKHVAITLASTEGFTSELKLVALSAIAKGTLLGAYKNSISKSESRTPSIKSVKFFGFGSWPEVEKELKYTEDVCSGIIWGKKFVDEPANELTPEVLAEEAEKIAAAAACSDAFTLKILDTKQCEELKMGSYLGVAAASASPPKFIHLRYKPPSGPIKAKLAIVGKGLTFNCGAHSIEMGPGDRPMKLIDMGGSAAVFGAAKALGQIKPSGVEVHFIVAACENMTSGIGMRPGDILTASNGKTIEVKNDDAEGGLSVADALVYACNQGVDKIVDLATLGGASPVVALGHSIAGIFTTSDELSKEVVAASEVAGEKLWRLPMEDSYWESMKSGMADMLNTGGHGDVGSITAALFLKQV